MKKSRPNKANPITGHALPVPVIADEASLSTLRGHTGLISRAWGWLRAWQGTRSTTRRLRVAETVSLGEKRFVAVVQVDGRHFLLAGGAANIALLAQLDTQENFGEVLKKTLTTPSKQVAKHKRPANAVMRAQVNLTNSPEDAPQDDGHRSHEATGETEQQAGPVPAGNSKRASGNPLEWNENLRRCGGTAGKSCR